MNQALPPQLLPDPPTADADADADADAAADACRTLCIDAGVCHVRIQGRDAAGELCFDRLLPSNADLRAALAQLPTPAAVAQQPGPPLLITGRLAPLVREALGRGREILPAAAAWLTARERRAALGVPSLALLEISASGYLLAGVEASGALKDELLITHPRCGAGSGVNLDRILQKLGLRREQVDELLADYLGEAGAARRAEVPVRADRCGVFAASATISDKNQGIPLADALAATLKSEVLKGCRRLPDGFAAVLLTGRFFHWRFARDCAQEALRARGVEVIEWDPANGHQLAALAAFAARLPAGEPPAARPAPAAAEAELPPFATLRERCEADGTLLRLPEPPAPAAGAALAGRPLQLGLDVGSTMAKAVLADADSGEPLYIGTFSNAGDTIETVKRLFAELTAAGIHTLRVRGIGITGSARYQVKEALAHLYPDLAERILTLVENYAHARGSIALARARVAELAALGVAVERERCILVDIGGEDTKVSVLDLPRAELTGNAMNLKCSAGTGSLMDTLAALFDLPGAQAASAEAQRAPRALALDATCAVFLLEHARRLQVRGVGRAEILASAAWAVVENMARSLWPQLELPPHAVVLLHGQTMRSDPLPLAVVHRLTGHLGGPLYGLIPPYPGHRACFGLIHTLAQTAPPGAGELPLGRLLAARFEKRIIECRGAACHDPAARCHRSHLRCGSEAGQRPLSFTLGGCTAINELLGKRERRRPAAAPVADSYKQLWDLVDGRLPRSSAPDRLVIPRSFVLSEWAALLAPMLTALGLPVHVDNVRESDLTEAQGLFNVDTCAPHMGAVGQFRRLAGEPHGLILAVQIERLPTAGASRGWSCTLNQGGLAVAANAAAQAHPGAHLLQLHLDLSQMAVEPIYEQLSSRLAPLFARYRLNPGAEALRSAIQSGLTAWRALREELQQRAAQWAEEALDQGRRVALVVGREYILNPGIYDSHVRRLLRDQDLLVLPTWVLDLPLDPEYGHLYWRNAHFIVSVLAAVSRRELHRRLTHPALARVFERIEAGPAPLPVVQLSTFSCGPDSIIQPLIAEIMRLRPFLLIQSDAVLKELAHLESRVDTYLRQLAPGAPHATGRPAAPFEVRTLDELDLAGPLNAATDVIFFPTLNDNRSLTAVLRGAGFTCIDNYREGLGLPERVRRGRPATGDAVCAPLAAVYGDLELAIEEFTRRRAQNDPLVAGKTRLLFFEIKGGGPCRQGLYTHVHQILFQRSKRAPGGGCDALPGGAVLKMLAGQESEGFNIGLPEWVLVRGHEATILQGVLDTLLFRGGGICRDFATFERFLADWRGLKEELYRRIERHTRPGPLGRALLALGERLGAAGGALKYLVYRAGGRSLRAPLRRFARRWPAARGAAGPSILLTGEIYMRVSQAHAIHEALLGLLGPGRFRLDYTPAWSYLEYLLDEDSVVAREQLGRLAARSSGDERRRAETQEQRRIARNEGLRRLMRQGLAAPLYRAAGLPLPPSSAGLLEAARAVLPTLRPLGELPTYAGEAVHALAHGTDLLLNVAPNGCLVSSMGEALGGSLTALAGGGRIQPLFSSDGSVDAELLALALLKVLGPEGFYGAQLHPAGND